MLQQLLHGGVTASKSTVSLVTATGNQSLVTGGFAVNQLVNLHFGNHPAMLNSVVTPLVTPTLVTGGFAGNRLSTFGNPQPQRQQQKTRRSGRGGGGGWWFDAKG